MTYNKQLSGHVNVVDDSWDGDGSFPDRWNVRIRSIRKEDRRLRALHDDLQVDVGLKQWLGKLTSISYLSEHQSLLLFNP